MRLRKTLLISAIAVALPLAGASGASAATLFTTAAHTTEVTVGATGSATSVSAGSLTSGTSTINTCSSNSLNLRVTQNSGGTVAGVATSGTVVGCSPFPVGLTFSPVWTLTVSGTSTTIAGTTVWNASAANISFDLNGGFYSGSLTNGVTVRQAHASGPICLRLEDSGTLSGPLTGDGRLDGNGCLAGATASWHLTN